MIAGVGVYVVTCLGNERLDLSAIINEAYYPIFNQQVKSRCFDTII